MILIYGALLGFIAVAFGAFAEHGLRSHITEEQFHFLTTALRYNQVHAAMVCGLGLIRLNGGHLSDMMALKTCASLFIMGTILFSISIYLAVWLGIPVLMKLAPIGGITLMIAWLMLIRLTWLARQR